MSPLIEFLVLRVNPGTRAYEYVGRTEAPNAGDAFRDVVMRPPGAAAGRPGEYLVMPLVGSVRFGVELNLRVLEQDGKPPEPEVIT